MRALHRQRQAIAPPSTRFGLKRLTHIRSGTVAFGARPIQVCSWRHINWWQAERLAAAFFREHLSSEDFAVCRAQLAEHEPALRSGALVVTLEGPGDVAALAEQLVTCAVPATRPPRCC